MKQSCQKGKIIEMESDQASRSNYKFIRKKREKDVLFNTLDARSAKYGPQEILQDKQPSFFNQ